MKQYIDKIYMLSNRISVFGKEDYYRQKELINKTLKDIQEAIEDTEYPTEYPDLIFALKALLYEVRIAGVEEYDVKDAITETVLYIQTFQDSLEKTLQVTAINTMIDIVNEPSGMLIPELIEEWTEEFVQVDWDVEVVRLYMLQLYSALDKYKTDDMELNVDIDELMYVIKVLMSE